MKIQTQPLIQSLIQLTGGQLRFAEELQGAEEGGLTWRAAAGSWNILECIEHLNRYSTFYLEELERVIGNARSKPAVVYTPGALGNYFARIIHPDTASKKMKTGRSMNTLNCRLTKEVLATFITNQQHLMALLEKAKQMDLGKERTATSLSSLIRLKLGDTLRFVAYHNERHIRQAKKIYEAAHQHAPSVIYNAPTAKLPSPSFGG